MDVSYMLSRCSLKRQKQSNLQLYQSSLSLSLLESSAPHPLPRVTVAKDFRSCRAASVLCMLGSVVCLFRWREFQKM
jgi:hypothetical protein